MSAEAALLTRSWKVGHRTCTLTAPRPVQGQALCAAMEWTPSEPKRLTPAELEQYRAGRNQAVAEIARELRINAAVIEL